jgi:hypothetical protein
MKFRLTYQGQLPSTQRSPQNGQPDPRAQAKHKIRQHFHPQLERLWKVNPNLLVAYPYEQALLASGGDMPPTATRLAEKFNMFGWNFVPLVTEASGLTCALDILMLRPSPKNKASWFGDIDNRLKTLIDALRVPTPNENYSAISQVESEKPFYCLLEDDKFLTRMALETDEMLDPVNGAMVDSEVRLIITVEVRPYIISMNNLHFG